MAAADCLIALGSNQGPRERHLRFAIKMLAALPRTRLIRASSFIETQPVGGPSQGPFLNAAARLRTGLTPMGLLVELKRLESLRGRRPGVRWGPRPLDCDIIYYGARSIRTSWLRIPHPRAHRRGFVRGPAAELGARARKMIK